MLIVKMFGSREPTGLTWHLCDPCAPYSGRPLAASAWSGWPKRKGKRNLVGTSEDVMPIEPEAMS